MDQLTLDNFHMLAAEVNGSEEIMAYASGFESGEVGVVLINEDEEAHTIRLSPQDFGYGERFYLYSLVGGEDNGNFSTSVYVNGEEPSYNSGGPSNVENILALSASTDYGVKIESPARSVQFILIESGDRQPLSTSDEIEDLLRVYPNPVEDKINIWLNKSTFEFYELYDLRGVKISSGNISEGKHNIEVDTDLPAGMYLLNLQGKNEEIITKKLIIR